MINKLMKGIEMQKDIIQYDGYNNFKCITDKCKHTCCSGWQVDIDNKTYEKYRGSVYFKDSMDLRFTSKDEANFFMKLNDDRDCSFLQEDKLCEIHANHGEEFLCNTCRVYPRGVNVIGDRAERHLFSSCHAMIDMFLLNDRKLTFEVEEGNYSEDEISRVIDIETDMEKMIFTAVRGFTIEVIQSDFISLEEKFVLLGLAYSNFAEFNKSKDYDSILNAIDIYTEMIEDSTSIPHLEASEIYDAIKSIVLGEVANFNLKDELKEIIPNLEYVLNGDEDFNRKYESYLEKNSTYIENYLVNAVYSSGMPFISEDMMDNYILLVVKYIAFKVYITSVKEDEITNDNFIDVVALSSRSFDHNQKAVAILIEELKTLVNSSDDAIGVLVNMIR
ncbi:MAG: flagellin lysine-N-methylase [Sarcina sp.]